uniref:WKF domain-containing protein n=1 Tax=Callorhinchus milii TaxID=7868 RepID=V9L8K5_CALMI
MAKRKKSESEPEATSPAPEPGSPEPGTTGNSGTGTSGSTGTTGGNSNRRRKKKQVARVQHAEEGGAKGAEDQPVEGAEEEELTPEEKRKVERKLKKERKKVEKRLLREAGLPVPKKEIPERPLALDLALQYLSRWATKREEWRFQKTRQTWLLQNMYDCDKVPDKYFDQLLEYLDGLKGNARQVTVQKAEALMKESGTTEEPGEDLVTKCRRARQVLQQLS